MPYAYKYPHPAVTVDCAVFGLDDDNLKVLLIQRDIDPFEGKWALPGGFVQIDEPLEEAALRELKEETGLSKIFLEQLYTFGKPDRDPRERVISVAFFALVNIRSHRIKAATDARSASWFEVKNIPALAFDHQEILATALERIKGKVSYQPIGFELLPKKFSLNQLQHLYETILERSLDKRNFRRKILGMSLIEETGETEKNVAHRAARLYRFDKQKYQSLLKKGFNFEV